MRHDPSPARQELDGLWLRGEIDDATYVIESRALDWREEEDASERRNRWRNVWRGFLIGLASPLLWLKRL